jgi:hypothetical protein
MLFKTLRISLKQIPLIGVVGLNKDITDLAVLIDQSQHYRNLFAISRFHNFCTKTKSRWWENIDDYSSVSEKERLSVL